METLHTETQNGYTLKIVPDYDPMSPKEWDSIAKIVTTKNRYFELDDSEGKYSLEDLAKEPQELIVFSLYAYVHSGVSLSLSNSTYPFNDRWDSGRIGFIYIPYCELPATINAPEIDRKNAFDICLSHVETWNQYLSGNVYGYIIEDNDGDHVDSCFGFYGYENVLSEARSMLKHFAEKQLELPFNA